MLQPPLPLLFCGGGGGGGGVSVEKLPKDFKQSDRLEVQRAGSESGKQAATVIASSLVVKW